MDILLYKDYFVNTEPVPYTLKKGGQILIYPLTLNYYNSYEWASSILNIKKNELNDINIIQMTYLDFLINVVFRNDKTDMEQQKLLWIFKYALHEDYIAYNIDKGKYCICICDKDSNITKVINHKEFDDIATIILNQNNPTYDNRYINPEVKELLQDYYKAKYSDVHSPSLEKRKAFVCSKLGKTFHDLNLFTIYEFELIYKSAVDSEIYFGQKIIQGSYKYEVKQDIKHPLFEPDKDPYAEIFENTNVLSGKGISGAERLNALNTND